MVDSPSHPNTPPATLQAHFQRPWDLLQPRVYRFMESKYIDQFFADGSLMLSSFERFAQHADEQRNDTSEGCGVRILTGSQMTVVMATGRGKDCYVLCGATANTSDVRRCFPEADACLVIDNPLEFANAISTAVPSFLGGAGGHCIYQDDTTIARSGEGRAIEEFVGGFEGIRAAAAAAGGLEEVFVKHSRYAAQAEYRMLWRSAAPVEDRIFIKCPAARSVCRRLSPLTQAPGYFR